LCYYTFHGRISIFSDETDKFFIRIFGGSFAVGVAALIGLYFLFSFLYHQGKAKKKAPNPRSEQISSALGGEENILAHELIGSRIVVSLKDYTKINRPLLEEAGVTGFIEKSDKLTLVIKDERQSGLRDDFHRLAVAGEDVPSDVLAR
jgi:phosphotransferase system IIB component